ncbi:MAG: hypothetical protein GX413_00800 [Acetobacter sp.]|nr:hypothetical protein [Acetobacter sp.]
MRRYGLSSSQWKRIKNILPSREGHVGGTAADNRLLVEATLHRYGQVFHGAILLPALVTGKTPILLLQR